jgi:hypothetical protein
MGAILVSLLLTASAPDVAASSEHRLGASYQTRKSLVDIQKCLTDKLSELGDVDAVKMQDSTTLVLRWGADAPMLIDLAPPNVTVTTRFAKGTRPIVEECL